ncbi:50S ribosome-binding GTPase [bacterium]|nr:50S ribosome-binding GTPase [bacterium]
MTLQFEDTIAALASASGPADRSVIRVSGPDVVSHVQQVVSYDNWPKDKLPRRYAVDFQLEPGCLLPLHLHLWPTHRSYTGQPMAELHVIGSPPVVEEILNQLYATGVRSARPGEFTLRSFLAGRVDLVQAEAVLGVIDANDHEELQQALGQLAGGISNSLKSIQLDLISLLGDLEAGLDFVEEDIEFVSQQQVIDRIDAMLVSLEKLKSQADTRMVSTAVPRVVLAGLPNAGKSTLFNALTGDDTALVSPVAGTTRDYLSAVVRIGQLDVEIVDTAGTETATGGIDSVAQVLGQAQHEQADVLVWCVAADLSEIQFTENNEAQAEVSIPDDRMIVATTKCDLTGEDDSACDCPISATTGAGLERLFELIEHRLTRPAASGQQMLGSTSARCHESLDGAIHALTSARDAAAMKAGDELIAVELRMALDAIGRILGVVYTDDILDHIFSNFCIGK